MALLISCAATSSDRYCPQPLIPPREALDWYEAVASPPAFDDWFQAVAKQEDLFKHGCKTPS